MAIHCQIPGPCIRDPNSEFASCCQNSVLGSVPSGKPQVSLFIILSLCLPQTDFSYTSQQARKMSPSPYISMSNFGAA